MLRSINQLTLGVRRLAVTNTAAPARVPTWSLAARSLHISSVWADKATGAESPKTTRKLTGQTTTTKKTTKTTKAAPKKAKKPAKPKAAPKPKRVLSPPKPINSAWVLFYKNKLAELPAEEKKKVTELAQKYVEEFRSLSSEERAKLDSELEEYKKKYEADLAAYKEKITPEMIQAENEYRRQQRRTSKKKKNPSLLRDPSKPVAPTNGYVRFCNSIRNDPEKRRQILGIRELTDTPAVEQVRTLAGEWKKLTDEEKKPFNDEYENEKKTYIAAMEEYKAKQGPKTEFY